MPEKIIHTSDPSVEVTVPASTISSDLAVTIPGLFRERVKRSPDAIAYRYFDQNHGIWKESTWQEMGTEVARCQAALQKESLEKGDHVAIMAKNCREWVVFDQAVLGLGLVLVPLYTQDRADNVAYILRECHAKLLVIDNIDQWSNLKQNAHYFDTVNRIISIEDIDAVNEVKLLSLKDWLAEETDTRENSSLIGDESDADELATIVYTSGTTGNAKGVMLSHRNILCNTYSGLRSIYVTDKDTFLSFFASLSHARANGRLLLTDDVRGDGCICSKYSWAC